MKKIIVAILICLGCITNTMAQEKQDIGERAKKHRQELVKHQDEVLEFLLQIPFEQRQYIFPMLSEKRSIPKKIKTHPDILVWKGKRPTRIAKRFQNDPELLEFLPAQFYYFLAPEMWAEGDNKSLEGNPNQLFLDLTQRISAEETEFTPNDLVQLKNGLNIVYDSLTQEQKNQLKNPSEVYLEQLILFNAPQIAEELKQQGFESPQNFAKKIDKIASAYRQYKKGINPPESPEQGLVKDYFSLIPYIFQKSGFSILLEPNSYSD